MVDIQDILCVLEVAKEKSITKAAANLFLTQSAVSQKISRTEKALGLTFFDRTNRSVELTEAGAAFVKHATRMSAEYKLFLSEMKKISSKTEGTLTIGMNVLTIYSDLPELISAFTAANPGWKINLATHHLNSFSRIQTGEVDFFFLFTNGSEPLDHAYGFAITPLTEDALYIFFHGSDSLNAKDYVEMTDISGYNLVSWNSDLIKSFPKSSNLTLTLCEDSALPSLITGPGQFFLAPKCCCDKIINQYPHLSAKPYESYSLTLYLIHRNKAELNQHPFCQFVTNHYKKQ